MEKAPTRGLLRDCEIFANLRIAFVTISSAQSAQRPPLGEWSEIRLLPARPVESSLHNCAQRQLIFVRTTRNITEFTFFTFVHKIIFNLTLASTSRNHIIIG